MIAKTVFSPATVYTLPLPSRIADTDSESRWKSIVTAKEIRRLALPLVTGIDFDLASGDLWVTNYFKAFRFQASNSEQPAAKRTRSLADLLGQNYLVYRLPKWKQIEAIAVDSKSNVWVTTEGIPARLGRLSLYEFSKPRPVAQE